MRNDREKTLDSLVKEFYAIIIQRHVRGWSCRRKRLDCSARANFLREIQLVNSSMSDRLQSVGIDNIQRIRDQAEQNRRNHAVNQHHLLSTIVRPGVYNPSFSDRVSDDWGIPMETLIKNMKRNYS